MEDLFKFPLDYVIFSQWMCCVPVDVKEVEQIFSHPRAIINIYIYTCVSQCLHSEVI